MKKHIHFTLLILGTLVFLWYMRIYTAPLRTPDENPVVDAATLSYVQIVKLNESKLYTLHTLDIMKWSFNAFAFYVGFVVLVIAHRTFYGSPGRFKGEFKPPQPSV